MNIIIMRCSANFISRTIGGKWTIVSACCMFMIGSALLASAVNLWMVGMLQWMCSGSVKGCFKSVVLLSDS